MKKVTVNIPIDVYLIEDGEFIVSYSPLTETMSYAKSEEGAIEAFKEVTELTNEVLEGKQDIWLNKLKSYEEE